VTHITAIIESVRRPQASIIKPFEASARRMAAFYDVVRRQQAIIESVRRQQASIIKLLEASARPMAAFRRAVPGTLGGDLFILFSQHRTRDEKMLAAERLAREWFVRPIAPQRFARYRERLGAELRHRAQAHGTSRPRELVHCVQSALVIAAQEIAGLPAFATELHFERIRRRVNDLVMEDLLGTDWRAGADERQSDEEGGIDIPLSAEVELALLAFSLREAELALIGALIEAGGDLTGAAVLLGKNPGAVRTAMHRLRKKMK
jgi:GGDEF domain-containing protein